MSGKRNVSVCRGHELAHALYVEHWGAGTHPSGEQIQNGRPADGNKRDTITPSCGPALICVSSENFEIKLLFSLLFLLRI